MTISNLAHKKCIPCSGGIAGFSREEIQTYMCLLSTDWQLSDKNHLCKTIKTKNFLEALDFANRIGVIAENEGHHPDITVKWGECHIEIWTHKINALTESDFILAAKIDQL
jgi:4a-hydroxytetrahydrobiopterin dehydratase